MKKYLIKEEGKFYKANLHMHTTVSDGKMTPEEVKRIYKEKGYSIVAYTDHELMLPHNELNDDEFLTLTSTEISINKRKDCDFIYSKCYHLNIISKDPFRTEFNVFSEPIMWIDHSYQYLTAKQREVKYKREYSIECINEMIRMANEEGSLVTLNHPVWSLQDYSDYIDLKGLWGVEWYNTGCYRTGYPDTIQPIDDLIRNGQNVYPVATDDAHLLRDCFGGFVMVKAEKLEYETIYNALKNGEFYSSSGPLINELFIEDGIITIKTSNIIKAFVTTENRYVNTVNNLEGMSEVKFDIKDYINREDNDNKYKYVRITIEDKEGNKAYTRAYYLNELK